MTNRNTQNTRWVLLLLAVAGFSLLIYLLHSAKPVFTGKDKSIVVLPFINMNKDSGNEYFNDGMTDEIISQLYKITDLKVISRPSSMTYKGCKKTIHEIADELHVAAILKGAVKKSGNRLIINARLIDAGTFRDIWSATYDRDIKDVFSIQVEVAQQIAQQLNENLTADEQTKISKRPTQNLEAYNQYLKGRYFYYVRTEASLRKGIEYFNQAIALDSTFSRAYSGLADCYSALGYISYELPSSAFLKAEVAAVKALQLDSTLAEPHTSLGYIKFYYYWNWKGAEQEFLEAIRLNPDYVQAFDSYGYYLTAMERFSEARMVLGKALEMDPLSSTINTDMGFSLYYNRNYDQAVNTLKSSLKISPKSPLAHLWLGRSYQEQKKYREAIEQYQGTLDGIRDWPVAFAAMAYVYAVSGQKAEAAKILAKMNAISISKYVTPYGIALVYASLNEKEKAFEWLDKAYAERSNWLVWLKLDPRWANIRNDERYQALIAKIGLSKNDNLFSRE